MQLVAVVPDRSIDPGAGVISHRGFPADAVPRVGGCDPRVPDGRAEGAPGRVEQEVTAQRALPGEDGVRTAGVFSNQDVGVEQISVDQVTSLGTGVVKSLLEPYLRAEWRMAITESDGSLGQFGAWACHRRRQSRHGRARTGVNWQAHACAACAAGFAAILESPEQGKRAASNRIQPA